jgi:hypothetical protein
MGKFKPGQSGNPGGRPKVVSEIQAAARLEGLASIKTLVEIRNNKKNSTAVRIAAANSLLDRGYGRPAQVIDATMHKQSMDEMSDAELMAIAASADEETPSPGKAH